MFSREISRYYFFSLSVWLFLWVVWVGFEQINQIIFWTSGSEGSIKLCFTIPLYFFNQFFSESGHLFFSEILQSDKNVETKKWLKWLFLKNSCFPWNRPKGCKMDPKTLSLLFAGNNLKWKSLQCSGFLRKPWKNSASHIIGQNILAQ